MNKYPLEIFMVFKSEWFCHKKCNSSVRHTFFFTALQWRCIFTMRHITKMHRVPTLPPNGTTVGRSPIQALTALDVANFVTKSKESTTSPEKLPPRRWFLNYLAHVSKVILLDGIRKSNIQLFYGHLSPGFQSFTSKLYVNFISSLNNTSYHNQ